MQCIEQWYSIYGPTGSKSGKSRQYLQATMLFPLEDNIVNTINQVSARILASTGCPLMREKTIHISDHGIEDSDGCAGCSTKSVCDMIKNG